MVEDQYVPDVGPPPGRVHRDPRRIRPGLGLPRQGQAGAAPFGSYYTPDNIVDHIVRGTLDPICDRLTADIAGELAAAEAGGAAAATLDALHGDFPNRLLRLRLLDPSMGSGHFLLAACQYLAEQIATNPYTPADPDGGSADDALSYWKRRVIENCLYGVDLNPLAVDLAKLACGSKPSRGTGR